LRPLLDQECRSVFHLTISVHDNESATPARYQEDHDIEASQVFTRRWGGYWMTSRWTRVMSSVNGGPPSRDQFLEVFLGLPRRYGFDRHGRLLEIRGLEALAAQLPEFLGASTPTTEQLDRFFRVRWDAWNGTFWGALADRALSPQTSWERTTARPMYNPPIGRIPLNERWELVEGPEARSDRCARVGYRLTSQTIPLSVEGSRAVSLISAPDPLAAWVAERVPRLAGAHWATGTWQVNGEAIIEPKTLMFTEWRHQERIVLHGSLARHSTASPEQVGILLEVFGRRR